MLIESPSGKKMLIDCGSDVRHSLFAQGYKHSDIDAVYVSHLHSDHTGGLEWLGFLKRFIDKQKPSFYISPDQLDEVWNHVLIGGMSSLEDRQATLSSYFKIESVKNNRFTWENYNFQLIKTHHVFSNSHHKPSYGLLISGGTKKILISTDTRFSPDSFKDAFEEAELIFHDCETSKRVSEQHARYEELKTLPPNIKQKMWLYHYNDGVLPDAQKDGFLGFVVRGQSFTF
jgi:ribonuclease BN (tRNA processing enzyme)